ncbi:MULTISPECIES: adenylate/guanylate cyclase domain-containing protein [unclassified Neptuniibacter]|uniref:CHASE2 domain-containing protein n=1 Tax=unclassified Neptuniibacter TaxID=2630693 RepID=UPI0025DB52CE|nr:MULTISPECIES: adenylate/guanylate cyclase domain-containing protein [unclassified Neptuniibacter]|tara:strand:+ start:43945 stop:45801 length:1857 start_codon:yes stop_codon:yes gene_type:complete
MVENKQRSDVKVTVVISSLFLLFVYANLHFPFLQRLDNIWLDFTVQQRAKAHTASDQIVVIDIDDASLSNLAPIAGNWPWPRAIHAELVELIEQQGPKAIVFDILFADRDIFNPQSDQYFSEVLAATDNVYLPFLHLKTDSDALFPRLDQYPDTVPIISPAGDTAVPHASLVLPKAVDPEVWRLGSINFHVDDDGVGRRYASSHRIGNWGIETMPARLADDLSGYKNQQKDVWLDWYSGMEQPYQRLPYAEVYAALSEGRDYLFPDFFSNKIIVIGSTAAGLHDIQVTPISSTYPGVFILATAIDNFLNQDFLHKVSNTVILQSQLILFLLFVILLLRIKNLVPALLTLITAAVLLCAFSYYLMLLNAIIFPVISWITAYLFLAAIFYINRMLRQQREIKKTVDVFGRFLDPKVVKILLEQGLTDQALAGKNTRVTILFTDIREFTQLSEYRTATEIVALLNQYFSRQVEVIFNHQGTLDKFIGDAIMAFWGEPVESSSQEISAVNAALDMVDQMIQFRRECGLYDFDIGIGLHTGDVVVGAIGTQSRYDYTAIGDAVNVASRIEGLTKETGRRVLVSEETRKACGTAFDFELIGDYKVKGREELVTVYQPRRLSDEN